MSSTQTAETEKENMDVEPKIGGFFYPPKMDDLFIMENPMNKWMIRGYHYFLEDYPP